MDDLPKYIERQWHLNKAVPISFIFYLFVQIIVLVVFATRLDSRVSYLEKEFPEWRLWNNEKQVEQDRRLTHLEVSLQRLAVIESRQNDVIKRLDFNADKLEQILNRVK